MDQVYKDLLKKNHMSLKRSISKGVIPVLEYLESTKIISEDMKERVECENKTPGDQASALLYLIKTRGRNAFQALYDALLHAEIYEAADVLKPDQGPHGPSYQALAPPGRSSSIGQGECDELSEDEPLPDYWPLAEQECDTFVLVKTIQDCTKSKQKLQKLYDHSLSPAGQDDYYSMLHKKRGFCLILSNQNFKHLEERKGTDRDVTHLNHLFTQLGYDTYVKKDQTSKGMKEILRKQVLDKNHTNYDCFILVILTHGEKGVVFGTYGRLDEKSQKPEDCLEVLDIRKEVCSVPSLLHKPKLIFIQACRGKQRDEGQSLNSGKKIKSDGDIGGQDAFSGGGESPNDPADSGGNQDIAAPNVTPEVLPRPSEETEQGPLSSDFDLKARKKPVAPPTKPEDELDACGEIVPSLADSFLAMSTTEGYLSWRNTKSGTWFIQAIVYVFSRFAYKLDINKLMEKVTRLVSKGEEEKKGYKQICEWTPTMRKTFYFFPGQSKID
ncbi:caspase [Plakobranchus ocellatus]|uniref:Caspase n=1 Tax=Plakobranchus ocellatus TaxID=259542 RepID=A0AAV4B0B5_9GAST|nr:caspase [Plakobranchus ocellatus]